MIMMPSLDAYAEKIKGIFDLTADMSYATQFKKIRYQTWTEKGCITIHPPKKNVAHKHKYIMQNLSE